jgi:hypothetical protein
MLAASEIAIGLAVLVLYVLTIPVLWRGIRRAAPGAWLANRLNAEYAMLSHIALLIVGVSLVLLGVLG